jgi:hypothetical protein
MKQPQEGRLQTGGKTAFNSNLSPEIHKSNMQKVMKKYLPLATDSNVGADKV